MNISLAHLGNEDCHDCQAYSVNVRGGNCSNPCDISAIMNTRQGIRKQGQHTKQKKQKLTPLTTALTVQICRRSSCYLEWKCLKLKFTRRICLFNETFASVSSKKQKTVSKRNLAFLWLEGIMGRKDEDTASTFWRFISENRFPCCNDLAGQLCRPKQKLDAVYCFGNCFKHLWCFNVSRITLKYFEKDHTFMSADTAHAEIEDQMRRAKQVYDFKDFVECVERTSCKVLQMKASSFRQQVNGTSQYKYRLRQSQERPILGKYVNRRIQKGFVQPFLQTHTHTYKWLQWVFFHQERLRSSRNACLQRTKRGAPAKKGWHSEKSSATHAWNEKGILARPDCFWSS